MTAEFKHQPNKGRVFFQFGAIGQQPVWKGQMLIHGEMTEVSGWKASAVGDIDLRFEPIAKAEAIRAKAKERRKKGRKR